MKRIITIVPALVVLVCSGLAVADPGVKGVHQIDAFDNLGGILGLIVIGLGALVLGGLAITMMVGAMAPKSSEITSWPGNQEGMFMPFNERSRGSQSQAWMVSLAVAAVVFIFVVGVKYGVTPDIREVKGMNMSNLTKKDSEAPAPKAEPKKEAPAEAPKAEEKKDAPAEAPKTDDKKTEEKK